MSARFQIPFQAEPQSSPVHECGKQRGPVGDTQKLELKAKLLEHLQFKCQTSETLGPEPAEDANFTKFYAYNSKTGCDTSTETALEEIDIGATLVREPKEARDPVPDAQPVYTFHYTSEPEAEKHLCYTCNTTNPPSSGEDLRPNAKSATQVSCAIHIAVPGKATPPTNSSTALPDITSDACTVTASVASATLALLAVVLRV